MSRTFAQATLEGKTTNSTGLLVGQWSSNYTGNGDCIGGNSTSGFDQTTTPASRPGLMQSLGVLNGNAKGLANGNSGNCGAGADSRTSDK